MERNPTKRGDWIPTCHYIYSFLRCKYPGVHTNFPLPGDTRQVYLAVAPWSTLSAEHTASPQEQLSLNLQEKGSSLNDLCWPPPSWPFRPILAPPRAPLYVGRAATMIDAWSLPLLPTGVDVCKKYDTPCLRMMSIIWWSYSTCHR
jgi:hypothetical protein